ncbi:hypothetical protein [Longimicrobium sp.]|uniref:hypothetical protein n=1 Tax=Longimicrobium sp. TaxID=2029185 RepID=UPI002D7FD4B4|nr:hypothetical protein [Longimicrobium sp.]
MGAIAAAGLLGAAPAPGAAATTPLSIDYFYCISLGHGRMECQAQASGGTGSYTFSFTPSTFYVSQSGGYVDWGSYCNPYRVSSATVTVNDGTSSVTQSTSFYCGDAV